MLETNENMSELIGSIIGNGNIYKKGSWVEITGYKEPYPRVVLHISNFKLMEQISFILNGKGFNSRISYKESSLYLNGKDQTKLFIREIGFSNIKHINRINKIYPAFLSFTNLPR